MSRPERAFYSFEVLNDQISSHRMRFAWEIAEHLDHC